jgi:hypothetical protein
MQENSYASQRLPWSGLSGDSGLLGVQPTPECDIL